MVTFQCSPGLVPSQQIMSVCAANGSWAPDPADLVCIGKPGGIVQVIITALIFFDWEWLHRVCLSYV